MSIVASGFLGILLLIPIFTIGLLFLFVALKILQYLCYFLAYLLAGRKVLKQHEKANIIKVEGYEWVEINEGRRN